MMLGRAFLLALALAAVAACGEDMPRGTTSDGGTVTTTTSAAGSSTTAATTTTAAAGKVLEVVVSGGAVRGGSRRERVAVNEKVTLRVTADIADEVHVHGYELKAPVEPGRPAEVQFTANIPGVFEVELEGGHLRLLELEVR